LIAKAEPVAAIAFGQNGDDLVHKAYVDANVADRGQTLAEMVTKLSKISLAHQPGRVWDYVCRSTYSATSVNQHRTGSPLQHGYHLGSMSQNPITGVPMARTGTPPKH
jgi:hypothetical protein